MNKYCNPRSKRKQKAKAKREQREFVAGIASHWVDVDSVPCALTPEEFILAEAKPKRMRNEPDTLYKRKRSKPVKEPKQVTAAA